MTSCNFVAFHIPHSLGFYRCSIKIVFMAILKIGNDFDDIYRSVVYKTKQVGQPILA